MLRALLASPVLLLGGGLWAHAQDTAPPHLSLPAAVTAALRGNDRMLDLHDADAQAELQLRLARSVFRPQVAPTISGSLGQSDLANQTYRLDLSQKLPFGTQLLGNVGAGSLKNQLGTYYASDTTLQINQPLLRGRGSTVTQRGVKSAEERRRDAVRQAQMSAQRLVVEVAAAYYRIVSQGRLATVARKSLERAQRLRDASQARLETGKVSQLDVARAQQLVAQAEGQWLDASGAVEDAKDNLRLLMGRGDHADFSADDEIPRATEPVSEDLAESTALARRPDLEGARALAADAERAVAFSKNQLLPQLDVSLALTRREAGNTFANSLGWDRFRVASFFNVSLPIDRRPLEVDYSNSLIERDRRAREARALERRVAGDARRGARLVLRLVKSLEVADAASAYARTELEVAQMRFDNGLSNNLDVVTAETNLLAAEGRQLETLAALAVARLDLRATIGALDPRADIGAER